MAEFFVDWPLRGLAIGEFGRGPSPFFGTLKTLFWGNVYEQDKVAKRRPAGFEQERRIEHDCGFPLGGELIAKVIESCAYAGVEEFLQEFAVGRGGWVLGKDTFRHSSAVDVALRRENRIAPTLA
jgi:hypothetical protein